jgi:exopolysaccharide biosynthesis polyprenyl glycosylphosphotransferase
VKTSELLFGILRIPLDAGAVFAALLLSYWLRINQIDLVPNVQLLEPAQSLPLFADFVQQFALPSAVCIFVLSALFHLYALRTTRSAWQEVARVLAVVLLWVVCVVGWYFLVERELFFSRMLLVHSTLFLTLFIVLLRTCVVLGQRMALRFGIGVHFVTSVGGQPLSSVAKTTLQNDPRYAYIGHAADLQALQAFHADRRPDLVIQTDPNPSSRETAELIEYCRSEHFGYAFLPPVFADVPRQLRVERLGFVPMIRFCPTPLDGWGRIGKRVFDLVVAATLLVVLSPFLLLVAVVILCTSGWPVFYVSKRVGEFANRMIPVIKFRSMVRDADIQKAALIEKNERQDGPLFKLTNDPRITPVGRILRRFDIDELPQLLNVLAGHMSLVGPRPHLPEEVSKYQQHERRVFAVRPGITGLAQISGRSTLKFHDEVRLDLQYVEEWSLLLDLWILWRTAFVVLFRRGVY